jgi:hypothetical protein
MQVSQTCTEAQVIRKLAGVSEEGAAIELLPAGVVLGERGCKK